MPEPVPNQPRKEPMMPRAKPDLVVAPEFRDGLSDEANIARNREFLAQNPEIGPALLMCYDEAIERFPELGEVHITPATRDVNIAGARSRYSNQSKTGRNEVLIDLEAGARKIVKQLADRPTTNKHFMEILGVTDPNELTPTRIMAFVFLHELGHTLDYTRRIHSREDFLKSQEGVEAEKTRRMPLPTVKTKELLDPAYQARLLELNPNLFARFGVTNFAGIRALNEAGYRQLSTETFADQFAVAILHRRSLHQYSSAD